MSDGIYHCLAGAYCKYISVHISCIGHLLHLIYKVCLEHVGVGSLWRPSSIVESGLEGGIA